jgi:glutamyl-Q tRNA(Asp) synthetase
MTPKIHPNYKGRFAPSPTGPLHFGSLVAAVGSYLDAKTHGGEWLIRMEDIDAPRVVPGSADAILRTLERFGFGWDGPVLFQSTRLDAYEGALNQLRNKDLVFACGCSRKDVGGRYPGTCRAGLAGRKDTSAWRLRVRDEVVSFSDRRLGLQTQNVEAEIGDFVVKRADGLFAYQLAVVVDDAAQGITDVVRGEDLLDSTPRQILLQRALETTTPRYLHLPLAVNEEGQKLSKQTGAPALDDACPEPELKRAMEFLGMHPPDVPLRELWAWAYAVPSWDFLWDNLKAE